MLRGVQLKDRMGGQTGVYICTFSLGFCWGEEGYRGEPGKSWPERRMNLEGL